MSAPSGLAAALEVEVGEGDEDGEIGEGSGHAGVIDGDGLAIAPGPARTVPGAPPPATAVKVAVTVAGAVRVRFWGVVVPERAPEKPEN